MGRLRWNPFLGEWVIMTPKRASRPFQDPNQSCPFCPGSQETLGKWNALTIDNKFPALSEEPGPFPLQDDIVIEGPAYGFCKVIITSPKHDEQIEDMSEKQIHHVMKEYLRAFEELDSKDGIHYVAQFENRGRSIGVSLNHPHAQVYALPFIPPRIQREIEQAKKKWDAEKRCLVCEAVENETKAKDRIIRETANFISCVPFFARLPYEVHIYPKRHVPSLIELQNHLVELGLLIQDTVKRYANFFDETAYVMIMHTRPSKGELPYWHFHMELYPPWRDKTRRKYLAGIEEGTGTYTNDSVPELTAKELREAI